MFVGRYEHSLDSKGRVVLPAPFRAHVADEGFVTKLDGCIGLWSAEGFRTVGERWKAELDNGQITSNVFRQLMEKVQPVRIDGAGRITLKQDLLEELGFDSKVVITGRYDRAEIWPQERHESERTDETEAEFNETVRRLGL